jgi:general secretion pathway protein L
MNVGFGFMSRWLDDVAFGFARLIGFVRRARKVELIERPDGLFDVAPRRNGSLDVSGGSALRLADAASSGPDEARERRVLRRSRVHVVLDPSHFLFRTLQLPRAAAPFVEGVVRAQIDRLTPWTASEAVFGWSAPAELGGNEIGVTVAATARSEIAPIGEALVAGRVQSIEMSTFAEEDRSVEIPILWGQTGSESEVRRIRPGMVLGLGAASLAFVGSLVAWILIGGAYDGRLADLEGQISERHARLMSPQDSAADRALQALKKRKRAAPSPVMILEALSKTLPDDTHLTELRIESGKVQIVGLGADASQVIRLIEQHPQFARAVFVAPTVKGPGGEDSFHIEAQLQPSFEVAN